ncbi:MAG TPA: hypothetical protein VKE94_06585 [Gemmataceae bacterium]|jgi:hypothetical protein|nr:hypothetical protein [Gemmataceae bacterium]
MADLLSSLELEFRIALLPPIPRGAHLDGPRLYAQQLVELWKIDNGDNVLLQQAFRLLEAGVIEGAILRTLTAGDYPSDPRRWVLPPLNDLLPELWALSWRAMQNGELLVEGIKGVRGRAYRPVQPAELMRLTPDWAVERLCNGTHDEFIDVRVRRPPAVPVKPTWRPGKPSRADLENWLRDLAKEYPDVKQRPDRRPTFEALQIEANNHFKTEVPRDDLRAAIDNAAPQLKRSPGQRIVK